MLSQERVRELFSYDPETGNLIRRVSVKGRNANTEIGTTKPNGYKVAVVDGKSYRVHHLVWLYHHGKFVLQLDHINRNTSDNRIENLRPCNCVQNSGNSLARSGKYKGVSFCKQTGRWKAQISKKGRNLNLGRYDTPEEAALVYNDAAREYFGEFAHLNEVNCDVINEPTQDIVNPR